MRRRNNPRRKRAAKATSSINHSNQLTTACKNRWVNFFQVFPLGRVTRGTKWRHWGRARKGASRSRRREGASNSRGQEWGISWNRGALVGCLWNCNSILVRTLDRRTKRKILIPADGEKATRDEGNRSWTFLSRAIYKSGKRRWIFRYFSFRLNSFLYLS